MSTSEQKLSPECRRQWHSSTCHTCDNHNLTLATNDENNTNNLQGAKNASILVL